MDLSIAILSYNTRDHLLRALEALKKNTQALSCEIFVVDNGSKDGSAEAVRAAYPEVEVIALPENRYYAAYNLAFEKSRGEFFLVLSSDVEIRDDILGRMLAQARQDPSAGAWGARMYFPDGRLQRNGSADFTLELGCYNFTLLGKLLPWRARALSERVFYADWDRTTPRAVGVWPDSFLMIRRKLFEGEPLYDPRFKLYFTENDLCLRIRRKGSQIHYVPEGEVFHMERGSVDRVDISVISAVYRSDIHAYFSKYHGTVAAALLAFCIQGTRLVIRLLQRLGLKRFKKNLVWGISG